MALSAKATQEPEREGLVVTTAQSPTHEQGSGVWEQLRRAMQQTGSNGAIKESLVRAGNRKEKLLGNCP